MNIKRLLAVVLAIAVCVTLIAGCGKSGSQDDPAPSGDKESGDSTVPGGNSGGDKTDPKKDDGKKDDGKKDDPASGSDAPTVIVIPSATPGNADTQYEVEPDSFSDTAGQVTKIDGSVITYKVMESKSGEALDDYALFDPADYKTTDKTATLEYDDATPFYTREGDKWYIAVADQLKAGDTILVVVNDDTGNLEGVIIFSK